MPTAPATCARLDDRRVLAVTGTDAHTFLNGLVTNEVPAQTPGGACHAALLTPQGKILFAFHVVAHAGGFWIDIAAEHADDLAKRLGFYKLRADVEISSANDRHVFAFWGGDAPPGTYPDPRLAALGSRAIADEAAFAATAGTEDYAAHRIAHAVPQAGIDYPLGNSFPHDACFDLLGGVSFSKGCYVGQEVVSRMRHRGTARRRVVHVAGGVPLPEPGTPVTAGAAQLGALGSSAGTRGLAILRIDRVIRAGEQGDAIEVEGASVTLRVPAWADYSISSDEHEGTD